MHRNVRAALALSLPVGLIVLSAGGAVLGLRNASHDSAAAVPAVELVASSPPAKSPQLAALEESRTLRPLASEPFSLAAREPYEPPTAARQLAQVSEAARSVESERYADSVEADQTPWQAIPTQYTSIDAPANASQPRVATPDIATPPTAAATPLPRAVEQPALQHSPVQRPPAPLDVAALAPVSQQAELRVEEAFRYARRGALYAARAELIQALRMIAQAVDTLEQGNRRSQSLAAGFQAMKEAEDFFVSSDTLEHDLDVAGIVLAHRTPVLKGQSLDGVSSLAALQQYYAFAQQQFSIAAAGTPAGSRALYGLGKVHMTLARDSGDDRSHQTPKAMAFFQAAMQADQRNYLAANELGVLLAQFGQLAEAKRVLVHSVSMQSHAEGWQNLAVVHSRMGEHELARKATYERELLIARSPGAVRSDRPVTWVGPQEFNSVGGPDAMATAPASPTKPGSTTRR